MQTLRERLINELIDREGSYVDNPDDSGGPTRYGITQAKAREWGYTGEMASLPLELAKRIYTHDYWDTTNLDRLADLWPKIAEELFDSGVNCGPRTAARWLQRSLNALNDRQRIHRDLAVDGIIGNQSVAAISAYLRARNADGQIVLLRALNGLQTAHYITLAERREKDEQFMHGWLLHRVVM